MSRWFKISLNAAKGWSADNAFKHSAAVSFYTLFSLAPVTIIALGVAGFFFGAEAARGQFTTQMTQLIGKEGADVIQKAVATAEPQREGWLATSVGIGILIVGATTVFGQLQDSLNEIWGVTSNPKRNNIVVMIVQRLISFAMVLTVGFLLLVSLALSTVLTTLLDSFHNRFEMPPFIIHGADFLTALVVITVLFALMFKVLPDVVLRWRDVWIGALVTSLLFSIGRLGIALYLGHSTVASTYGAAGSLVALLVWVYYSCAILFYGVEFTRAYCVERRRPPAVKDTAVKVRRELVTKPGKHHVV
jgi:membrane protein